MAQPQYSITMAQHQRNVCAGLSAFQQNGEFVDMTLAADGHLVKVHQVLMGYASPYLKELITSTNCRHPVIFLNKVSYTSLCGILEYIYTGEVHVPVDKIKDLLEACHELRIHGLEHMNIDKGNATMMEKDTSDNGDRNLKRIPINSDPPILKEHDSDDNGIDQFDHEELNEDISESMDTNLISSNDNKSNKDVNPKEKQKTQQLQYTVSNRGMLQLILNRYMYRPGYFYKREMAQKWRCVDDIRRKKCPAFAVIKNGMVLQRVNTHNHPYHDVRILKKLRLGAVFSAVHDAEQEIRARRKANMDEENRKEINPQEKC